MAEKDSEMIQNLLNMANSLQERIESLEEEVSQLAAKTTPRPPVAKPAKSVAVTRPAMPSRSRKRPISRPTVTYRVDPRSAGDKSICSEPGCDRVPRSRGLCSMHYQSLRYKERKIGKKLSSTDPLPPPSSSNPAITRRSDGGTQSIFGLLGGEKGRQVLTLLINQTNCTREDLTKRVNRKFKDVPGVPLEEDDVVRFVHLHDLGGALAKKESENICSKMTKQGGSYFKTAQKLKMTVEKLNQIIQELGLEDVIEKIRLGFCEEILGQSGFAERLELALTKDKYLIDLGIEEEVDASLRKELDELLSTLGDKLDTEQAICKELSLDEDRYKRLVKRFELEQLLGTDVIEAAANPFDKEAASSPAAAKPEKEVVVSEPDKSSRSQTVEKRVCSQPGCELEVRCSGLCPKHYERRKYLERKTGKKLSPTELLPPPAPRIRKPAEEKICSQPGCERFSYSRGLCRNHYQRLLYIERKMGKKLSSTDPLPPPKVRKPAEKGICSQPGCERLSIARELCSKHYNQLRKIEIRTGEKFSSTDPLPPIPPRKARKTAEKKICAEPGCEQTSRSRGLCRNHYERIRYKERKMGKKLSSTNPLQPSAQEFSQTGKHTRLKRRHAKHLRDSWRRKGTQYSFAIDQSDNLCPRRPDQAGQQKVQGYDRCSPGGRRHNPFRPYP